MRQPVILLAVGEKQVGRMIHQLLRAALHDVESLKSPHELEAVLAAHKVKLVVVDSKFIDSCKDDVPAFIRRIQSTAAKVLLLNAGKLSAQIPALFRTLGVTNLIALNNASECADILVTINKLLRTDVFGLEKYLPWGLRVVKRTIHSSERKNAVLAELEKFAVHIDCAPRLAHAFVAVADELIANAIYDAPVGETGQPRFRHLERTVPVHLPVGEEVVLSYACDGQRFAVSVQDPYGSLNVETVINYLERWISRATRQVSTESGGAGLGFFFVFDYLSTFIVNLCPGRCTEFIGFIDITGTYKDFVSKTKSFHIFTGSPPIRS